MLFRHCSNRFQDHVDLVSDICREKSSESSRYDFFVPAVGFSSIRITYILDNAPALLLFFLFLRRISRSILRVVVFIR